MRLLAVAGEPLTYVLVKESNIATVHHAEHPSFAALSRAPLKTSVSTAGLSGEAAQMYSQIWSGEHLSFNVEHRAGGRGGVIQVTVLPEAGIPGTVEQRTVQISLLSLCLDTSGAGCAVAAQVVTSTEYLKDIGDMFMPLARRVMHLTLRSMDIDLGKFLRNLCERELNAAYRQEKRWPELVDLFCYSFETALAGEYVGYLSSHGVDLQSGLESRLAEVLEACGRFEEAALLYLESAQNESYEAQSIHNAGLAYKRAGMYSEAEALYHQSLRKNLRHSEQTRGYIGIPEALHVGLENMLVLYMAKTAAKVGATSDLEADMLNSKTRSRAEVHAKKIEEEIKNQSLNRERDREMVRLGARRPNSHSPNSNPNPNPDPDPYPRCTRNETRVGLRAVAGSQRRTGEHFHLGNQLRRRRIPAPAAVQEPEGRLLRSPEGDRLPRRPVISGRAARVQQPEDTTGYLL